MVLVVAGEEEFRVEVDEEAVVSANLAEVRLKKRGLPSEKRAIYRGETQSLTSIVSTGHNRSAAILRSKEQSLKAQNMLPPSFPSKETRANSCTSVLGRSKRPSCAACHSDAKIDRAISPRAGLATRSPSAPPFIGSVRSQTFEKERAANCPLTLRRKPISTATARSDLRGLRATCGVRIPPLEACSYNYVGPPCP